MPRFGSRHFPTLLRAFGMKPTPQETRFPVSEAIQVTVDADSYDPLPRWYFGGNYLGNQLSSGEHGVFEVDCRLVQALVLVEIRQNDATVSIRDAVTSSTPMTEYSSDGTPAPVAFLTSITSTPLGGITFQSGLSPSTRAFWVRGRVLRLEGPDDSGVGCSGIVIAGPHKP